MNVLNLNKKLNFNKSQNLRKPWRLYRAPPLYSDVEARPITKGKYPIRGHVVADTGNSLEHCVLKQHICKTLSTSFANFICNY